MKKNIFVVLVLVACGSFFQTAVGMKPFTRATFTESLSRPLLRFFSQKSSKPVPHFCHCPKAFCNRQRIQHAKNQHQAELLEYTTNLKTISEHETHKVLKPAVWQIISDLEKKAESKRNVLNTLKDAESMAQKRRCKKNTE